MNGINNNIAFRGALGEKFVREITVNQRTVSANELLQASKGKLMGLDSGKVVDIFEAFSSSLVRETREKLSLKERIESFKKELPERIQEAIKHTEESIFSSVRPVLENKDKEIAKRDRIIAELKQYEAMAKVKSIEELDVVMPETAIATAQAMKEHAKEAQESMLTYLLTGKGQEAVLEQTERSNILTKAMADGVTKLPEVSEATNDLRFAEPLYFLTSLMETALRDDRGAVVVVPAIKAQIKTNITGLLAPHYSSRFSNTTEKGVSENLDRRLEDLVQFHTNLNAQKEKFKAKCPDAVKIVFNPEQYQMEAIGTNGEIIATQNLF